VFPVYCGQTTAASPVCCCVWLRTLLVSNLCIRWARCKSGYRAPERTYQAIELVTNRTTPPSGRHQRRLIVYTQNSSGIKCTPRSGRFGQIGCHCKLHDSAKCVFQYWNAISFRGLRPLAHTGGCAPWPPAGGSAPGPKIGLVHNATPRSVWPIPTVLWLCLLCSQQTNWTELNWPEYVDPVTCDAFIGHSRQRHDYTSCWLAAAKLRRCCLVVYPAGLEKPRFKKVFYRFLRLFF